MLECFFLDFCPKRNTNSPGEVNFSEKKVFWATLLMWLWQACVFVTWLMYIAVSSSPPTHLSLLRLWDITLQHLPLPPTTEHRGKMQVNLLNHTVWSLLSLYNVQSGKLVLISRLPFYRHKLSLMKTQCLRSIHPWVTLQPKLNKSFQTPILYIRLPSSLFNSVTINEWISTTKKATSHKTNHYVLRAMSLSWGKFAQITF